MVPMILFKEFGIYKITTEQNFEAVIRDAGRVVSFTPDSTLKDIITYLDKGAYKGHYTVDGSCYE